MDIIDSILLIFAIGLLGGFAVWTAITAFRKPSKQSDPSTPNRDANDAALAVSSVLVSQLWK
jgi:hypothetical protein